MTTPTVAVKLDLRSAAALAKGPMTTVSRFAAALLGGYLFTYGFTALATFVGFRAGLKFSESQTLAWMIALLVYLCAILWGFASRSLMWAWISLAGGGVAMSVAAWALSRWLA